MIGLSSLFISILLSWTAFGQDCGTVCEPTAADGSAIGTISEQAQAVVDASVSGTCKAETICPKMLEGSDNPFNASFLGRKCDMFAVEDGKPQGDLAKYIYDRIGERKKMPYFSNHLSDLNDVCPAFPKFDEEMKKIFWIYFFQLLAHQESTCRAAYINNSAANPPGLGLYTMDGKPSIRRAKYNGIQNKIRDAKDAGPIDPENEELWGHLSDDDAYRTAAHNVSGWGEACHPERNLLSGKQNFLCALQHIDVQMLKDGIFSSNSYFSPLRPKKARKKAKKNAFRERLKLFTPCHLKIGASS